MAQWLEQSMAISVIMGPAVDEGDGVTPEIGLTAGGVDEIGVYKHGATSLTDISGTTTFTHRAGGMYTMTLSIADTGTLGLMTAYIRDDDVCLPFWKDFMVVPSNVWDSLFGADRLQVDVREFGDDTLALTTQMKADVDAECDEALSDLDLDHLIEVTAGVEEPTDGSYLDQMMHKSGAQTFDAATDSLEAIRDRGDAAWLTCAGVGAVQHTVTVEDGSGNPIADADVWITSDESGITVVASGRSDSNGKFYFWGDTGVTYWVWKQKDGYTFTNPTEFVIP